MARNWIVLVTLCSLAVLIPGCERSFHRDDQGRPHGTGTEMFRYPDGSIRVMSEFKKGSDALTAGGSIRIGREALLANPPPTRVLRTLVGRPSTCSRKAQSAVCWQRRQRCFMRSA